MERDRLWPGAIAAALRRWSKVARQPDLEPMGGSCCPLCNPFYMNDERELLELALHALPRRAARELRALIEPLDEFYLERSWQNPSAPAHYAWWARRCWG